MAKYDYRCDACGAVEEHDVPHAESKTPRPCPCGGAMEWQFPVEAAHGIEIQEAEYLEPLGIDVSGRREKRQVLKAMGYQEAGDRVHGARNEDKHATLVKRQPPRGITLSDVQRETDAKRKQKENMRLYAEEGTTARRVRPGKDKSKMVGLIQH